MEREAVLGTGLLSPAPGTLGAARRGAGGWEKTLEASRTGELTPPHSKQGSPISPSWKAKLSPSLGPKLAGHPARAHPRKPRAREGLSTVISKPVGSRLTLRSTKTRPPYPKPKHCKGKKPGKSPFSLKSHTLSNQLLREEPDPFWQPVGSGIIQHLLTAHLKCLNYVHYNFKPDFISQ